MNWRLDSFQQDVLVSLVEASRRVPEDVRPSFFYQHAFGQPYPRIEHAGLRQPLQISLGDMEVLARAGLVIHRQQMHGCGNLDLTPDAFEAYEEIQLLRGSPVGEN